MIQVENIKLVHRVIGTKHVFTSPDVPQLHVSHANEATARESVQPALEALGRVEERLQARKESWAKVTSG
jgi:hypothetical protein